MKSSLAEVAGEDNCRVNNALDRFHTPFDPAKVVERATASIGKSEYHPLFTNCEHFANWCRYGEAFSLQAERVLDIGKG